MYSLVLCHRQSLVLRLVSWFYILFLVIKKEIFFFLGNRLCQILPAIFFFDSKYYQQLIVIYRNRDGGAVGAC